MLKLQKTSQMRVAFLRGIKNSVSNTAAETKNYIGQNIRRYGMAAVALWGVSGTTGLTNVNAHAEHRQLYAICQNLNFPMKLQRQWNGCARPKIRWIWRRCLNKQQPCRIWDRFNQALI